MADIQSINLLWGYCFRAAHPRKPSWQHHCLCSVRRDFTVHHISEHLSGLLILETASGYRWVITNGMELNKTRSTGVNPASFIAAFLRLKKRERKTQRILNSFVGIWRETLAIYQNMSEFIELNTAKLHSSLIAYFGWSLFDKLFWKPKSCINQHFSTLSECGMTVCNVKAPLVVTNPNRIIIQQQLPLRFAEMFILFFRLGGEFEHLFWFHGHFTVLGDPPRFLQPHFQQQQVAVLISTNKQTNKSATKPQTRALPANRN